MKNQIATALLALSKLEEEKNRVNPRIKLKLQYREIKNLQRAVEQGTLRLDGINESVTAYKNKIKEIKENIPKLQAYIAREKEQLGHSPGMTLKEMLSIQQNAAKLEENLAAGESQLFELEVAIERSGENKQQIKARIRELKKQCNEKIKLYQQLKQQNELKLAALESKTETLREGLDLKILAFFDETLNYVADRPVVLLSHDVCGGCNIAVSSHLVKKVLTYDELQRCEHCKRILLPAGTSVPQEA